MPDNEIIRTFDASMRRRVRKTLAHYREEHGLGAIKLRREINAEDPLGRVIDISTLQRFLKGQHHTEDMSVSICHEFLRAKEVELLPEQDELVFGPALARYHVPPESDPTPIKVELREALIGSYLDVRTRDEKQDGIRLELTIAASGDDRFMLVKEIERTDAGLALSEHEGVLIVIGGTIHVGLRDTITGKPKSYQLDRIKPHASYQGTYLRGHVLSSVGFRDFNDQESTSSRLAPITLESGRARNVND